MRSLACAGILAGASLLAPVVLRAADAATPVAMMTLRDGRVLHNARVVSDVGTSVVVRADEGLVEVAKSDLPRSQADASAAKAPAPGAPEFVMVRFNPNQAPEAAPPEPGAKAAAKPVANANPAMRPVASATYKGCIIMSFQMKSFQNVLGCAEVVIRNDSDEATLIRPGDFVCLTADGARHPGRNLVADTFPPSVRRSELVPAHGEVDDIVTFANDALAISLVQWSK
jgi:hypothetical protein